MTDHDRALLTAVRDVVNAKVAGVAPGSHRVEFPAPQVRVEPPEVYVAAPQVTVEPKVSVDLSTLEAVLGGLGEALARLADAALAQGEALAAIAAELSLRQPPEAGVEPAARPPLSLVVERDAEGRIRGVTQKE